MRRGTRLVESSISAIAMVGLFLAVGLAAASTIEAVEQRQSAAAATDLLMASTTVAHADELIALGGDVPIDEVDRAVTVLTNEHSAALQTLDADEAVEAAGLINEIAHCGVLLLDSAEGARDTHQHDHDQLQELLRRAAQQSSEQAATAEREAALALAAMALTAAAAVAVVTRSRARAAKTQTIAAAQLRAGQRLQTLLNDSPDTLLVVDRQGRVSDNSTSDSAVLDRSIQVLDDLIDLALAPDRERFRSHLSHTSNDQVSSLFELKGQDGERGWFNVRVSDLTHNDLVEGHLITLRDVTNEVILRAELQQQVTTDLLTGLPNRRALEPSLDTAKNSVAATGTTTALITLDIDGFKAINDAMGHLVGDELLVQVATRLHDVTRRDETLLRLGGDEFALIATHLNSDAEAESIARRLREVLDEPIKIGVQDEHVRTSVGVATTHDPDHVEHLLHEADLALYEAKRLGGNAVVLFERALEAAATRRDRLTRALRDANYDEEFEIVYQPIVDIETRSISTLEALLRWHSPDLGDVTPDEFIPIAELTAEIGPIGTWVFDAVCRQVADWTSMGMDDDICVSVNVSARQLADPAFVASALGTVARRGIDPRRLVVEVTETAALDGSGVARARLEQLRSAGLKISIDDFGTGYSNLGQLLSIPFDVIKIDRSLLLTLFAMRQQAGVGLNDPCAIMRSIVSIATTLEAPVVCEGVETEDQFAALEASGVSHIQGYLTGRPGPADLITPQICHRRDLSVG